MANIAIIGAGAWGTTVANLAAHNNKEVTLWAKEIEIAESINASHTNESFLPSVTLQKNIKATVSLAEAIAHCTIVILAVPSIFFRQIAKKVSANIQVKGTIVVSVTKGIESGSAKTMSQILEDELPPECKILALSGPNHAEEVSNKIPTATVVAGQDRDAVATVRTALQTPWFTVFPHDDIIGVEVCGAVKNITAIAVGVGDALQAGDNAKGALITLGLREMAMLGKSFGAKQSTCYGLAGVGDLVATCTSKHSRNRMAGELLGKGTKPDDLHKEMGSKVAEGIQTAKSVYAYAEKNNLTLPLTHAVFQVIHKGKSIEKAVSELLKSL